MDQVVKAILVLMLAFVLQYLWQVYKAHYTAEKILEDVEVNDDLISHTQEFSKPEVIEVQKGIYVAIGFSLANSIMIDAPEGLIIIDTTEALAPAEAILKEFRQIIPDKPIKAIIYTHNHVDHTFGAQVFAEESKPPPDIWAYHTLVDEIHRLSFTGPTSYRRAMRQFGTFLSNFINAGIGPQLQYDKQSAGLVMPNRFLYDEEMDVTIAGLNVTLMHISGETADQMGMWMADQRIFFCGDNIYKTFPNLYAIRGTPLRDNFKWVNSLDKMRNLEPEILVPSHTRPIKGKENVLEILTVYRDGIQFVHDQTVKYMNKGLFPNDIDKLVSLPEHMTSHPYLKEFYGTVEWSVKGVFDRYMGWFSGDPNHLSPLSKDEKAVRMMDLAGGVQKALVEAQKSLDEKDEQWALQLSSYVFRLYPYNRKAKDIRLKALKALAGQQTSTNGRNYYLTVALEDQDKLDLKPDPAPMIFRLPLKIIFLLMSTRVNAEQCGQTDIKLGFNFTDIHELYELHLRNGIIETTQPEVDHPQWRCFIEIDSLTWRQILAKQKSPVWAYLTGEFTLHGGVWTFKQFMDCIEQD